ncbi:MAG: cupredoxin domain-containing protein [Rhodobacterales bacterium]
MKRFSYFSLIVVCGFSVATSATSATDPGLDPLVFNITLQNGVVSPKMTEIPVGGQVKIVVTNAGDATAEFESKTLHIEKMLAAGAKTILTLHGLRTGSYEFVDEYTEDLDTAHGFIIAK